jgi:large subunit ribosomal protein L3
MSKTDGPRHGSMQFWPRVRAKSETPRVRANIFGTAPINGFCGYKVGMTHVVVKDTGSTSLTKGMIITKPVTVVECPPIKVAGIRYYKNNIAISDVYSKTDKELLKSMIVPKSRNIKEDIDFDEIRLIVYTMPKETSIGKKKPEVFELAIKGNKAEQLSYAKEKFGKEIKVEEILKQNDIVDIHAVTTGKGFQGPVKRFGVQIRSHKSEKSIRNPGSLGPWCGQQHIMYRVAHAGQMGYNTRIEYNKPILLVDSDSSKVNPIGGFINYGNVNSSYILLGGSIPGHKKRLVRITPAMRSSKKNKVDSLQIISINKDSKQQR